MAGPGARQAFRYPLAWHSWQVLELVNDLAAWYPLAWHWRQVLYLSSIEISPSMALMAGPGARKAYTCPLAWLWFQVLEVVKHTGMPYWAKCLLSWVWATRSAPLCFEQSKVLFSTRSQLSDYLGRAQRNAHIWYECSGVLLLTRFIVTWWLKNDITQLTIKHNKFLSTFSNGFSERDKPCMGLLVSTWAGVGFASAAGPGSVGRQRGGAPSSGHRRGRS